MRPTIRDMLPRKGVAAVGVIAAVIMIAGVTAAVATGSSGSHDEPAVGNRFPSSYSYIEGTDRNGITATSIAQRASGGRYLPQQACSTDWADGRHCLDSIVFAGLARDSAIWDNVSDIADNANDIAAVDLGQIDLNRRNIVKHQTFTQFTGSWINRVQKRIDAQQVTIDAQTARIDELLAAVDAQNARIDEAWVLLDSVRRDNCYTLNAFIADRNNWSNAQQRAAEDRCDLAYPRQ